MNRNIVHSKILDRNIISSRTLNRNRTFSLKGKGQINTFHPGDSSESVSGGTREVVQTWFVTTRDGT